MVEKCKMSKRVNGHASKHDTTKAKSEPQDPVSGSLKSIIPFSGIKISACPISPLA